MYEVVKKITWKLRSCEEDFARRICSFEKDFNMKQLIMRKTILLKILHTFSYCSLPLLGIPQSINPQFHLQLFEIDKQINLAVVTHNLPFFP